MKYKVVMASPFEIGIIKDNKGLKTWWMSTLTPKKFIEIFITVELLNILDKRSK